MDAHPRLEVRDDPDEPGSPATRTDPERRKQRDERLEKALLRQVLSAADSYAGAVKTMHSVAPGLSLADSNNVVEDAFSELQRARRQHLLFLVQSAIETDVSSPDVDTAARPKQTGGTHDAELLNRLTARERQIVKLVAEGKRTKEIAHSLGISPKTVVTHRAHIMDKLRIHESTSLVRFAIRAGLCSA
jgi:DNA-binding CsgD family transcriptional regulator